MARGATTKTVEEVSPDISLSDDERAQLAASIANQEMQKEAEIAAAKSRDYRERDYILREKVIDPHEGRLATTTPIGWVPITDSMCTERGCMFDAAEAIGFENGWDSIKPDMYVGSQTVREFALEKLAQHKSIRHAIAGPSHIRTPEQMKQIAAKRPLPEGFITNPRL